MSSQRLDNGRHRSRCGLSVTNTPRDAESQRNDAVAPQAHPLALDELDVLLRTHNWTTFKDDDDEMTAVHVDVKDGNERYKYILGTDETGEGTVLLSKQHLLKGESRPFITLNVRVVIRTVAVLLKSEVSASSTPNNNKVSTPMTRLPKRDKPKVEIERSSSSDTVDIDAPSASLPAKQAVSLLSSDAGTSLKRKRPALGAYKQPLPLKDSKKARVRKFTTVQDENAGKDHDSIILSDDDDTDRDGNEVEHRTTSPLSKTACIEDWYGSSP